MVSILAFQSHSSKTVPQYLLKCLNDAAQQTAEACYQLTALLSRTPKGGGLRKRQQYRLLLSESEDPVP